MIKRIFALLLLAALPCMADATLQQALDSIDEWLTQAAQTGFGGGGGTDFSTANSYTYDDGTTQSVDGLIVRGDLTLPDGSITSNMLANGSITSNMLANGSIGTNHLSQGTIDWIESVGETDFDASVSFMGYPKLVLTTNMVTSYSGGIPVASFTNAFDNNILTGTSVGTLGGAGQKYVVDLGTNYTGFGVVRVRIGNTAGTCQFFVCATEEKIGLGQYGTLKMSVSGVSQSTGLYAFPIGGRYVNFYHGAAGGAANGTSVYYDISVYGVTEEYDSMGGF